MYHNDFIIRILQQFIAFLAVVLGLKDKNDPDLRLITIENGWKQFTGLDPRLAASFDIVTLLNLLLGVDGSNQERVAFASILFKEEARVLIETGFHEKAIQLLHRAIQLQDSLEWNPTIYKQLNLNQSRNESIDLLESIGDFTFNKLEI